MSDHDGSMPAEAADDEARRRRLVALLDDAGVDLRPGNGSVPARAAAGGPTTGPAPSSRWSPGWRSQLKRLCVITVLEVGVDGAGISVMGSADAARAGHRDQLVATGVLTERLEDLQLTTGEGPCLDAFGAGAPVLIADLAAETTRWLGFAPEAIHTGVAAVFSLPLQVGAVQLGTLDLHRCTVGGLSHDQLANALTLAGLATEALLELTEDPEPADSPGLAADPRRNEPGRGGPDTDRQRWPDAGWLPHVHADVHVASGMVSTQQDIDVGAALLGIRAYAFASGEPVHDVARRITERDLVLDDPKAAHTDPHDAPPTNPNEGPHTPDTSSENDD